MEEEALGLFLFFLNFLDQRTSNKDKPSLIKAGEKLSNLPLKPSP